MEEKGIGGLSGVSLASRGFVGGLEASGGGSDLVGGTISKTAASTRVTAAAVIFDSAGDPELDSKRGGKVASQISIWQIKAHCSDTTESTSAQDRDGFRPRKLRHQMGG